MNGRGPDRQPAQPAEVGLSRVEARRFEIVAAARSLFHERGIRRTTFGDVAERVGVTRGLVYHYFPTRDDLVDAAIDEAVAELLDAFAKWEAARRVGHVRESLESWIALLRNQVRPTDSFAADATQPENARFYASFLDRVVEAVVGQFVATTMDAYIEAHGTAVEFMPETCTVLLYGLVDVLRARPEVPDEVLVQVVWQSLRLEEPPHH